MPFSKPCQFLQLIKLANLRGWHQTRCRGPPSWVLNWVETPPIPSPSDPQALMLLLWLIIIWVSLDSLLLSSIFHLDFSVTDKRSRTLWLDSVGCVEAALALKKVIKNIWFRYETNFLPLNVPYIVQKVHLRKFDSKFSCSLQSGSGSLRIILPNPDEFNQL